MLAVRPPEYFPRLAYLALMARVETFVLADTFQYSRQSYQNRTRLRNPQGWQWISVPLKGGQHGTPIHAVRIRHHLGWQRKHWKALAFNYRSTPYFEYYEPRLRPFFEKPWHHLGALTCRTVEVLADLFRLPPPQRASDLPGAPNDLPGVLRRFEAGPLLAPDEAVVYDAQQVNEVQVLRYEHPTYRQPFEGFEPGMSALDLLFNYGPEARTILEQGICVEPYGPTESK